MSTRALPPAWTALAWCGAAAYPVVLYFTMANGRYGFAIPEVALSGILTALTAHLLRKHPLPALTLLLIAWTGAAIEMQNLPVLLLQLLVTDLAVGYVAATRSRRLSLSAAAVTLAVQQASAAAYPSAPDVLAGAIVIGSAMAATWLAGNSLRERREHARELAERATAQAVTAERLRIARELHDMVAHSIGIIAIQAGVGGRVIDTQPAEARAALAAIEDTSRETLSGLRRMLGALRRTDPSVAAPRDPAPGLADLDRLASATRDAGVAVDVRWTGARRPLPQDIDLSAFRIIQEAVTNVVRHAGTARCRVSIDHRDDELAVEILDDGQRRGPASPGYGLVGMRERVGLLNGDLTAGPRPEGGFRVAARLPLR
ncbi:sensor histidine kinase [Actinomadura rubrisoli]|uniref:histidine kinase n=1 Tax=Actinomadura rubrisoli TaxID=2530368 RepID=A0A4R5B788_9ACTN|nr:histidine kinase [Actinomadura rubrisoli]TDD79524.1 sensor histidine kinase [Actinomadura rubrisoli]